MELNENALQQLLSQLPQASAADIAAANQPNEISGLESLLSQVVQPRENPSQGFSPQFALPQANPLPVMTPEQAALIYRKAQGSAGGLAGLMQTALWGDQKAEYERLKPLVDYTLQQQSEMQQKINEAKLVGEAADARQKNIKADIESIDLQKRFGQQSYGTALTQWKAGLQIPYQDGYKAGMVMDNSGNWLSTRDALLSSNSIDPGMLSKMEQNDYGLADIMESPYSQYMTDELSKRLNSARDAALRKDKVDHWVKRGNKADLIKNWRYVAKMWSDLQSNVRGNNNIMLSATAGPQVGGASKITGLGQIMSIKGALNQLGVDLGGDWDGFQRAIAGGDQTEINDSINALMPEMAKAIDKAASIANRPVNNPGAAKTKNKSLIPADNTQPVNQETGKKVDIRKFPPGSTIYNKSGKAFIVQPDGTIKEKK